MCSLSGFWFLVSSLFVLITTCVEAESTNLADPPHPQESPLSAAARFSPESLREWASGPPGGTVHPEQAELLLALRSMLGAGQRQNVTEAIQLLQECAGRGNKYCHSWLGTAYSVGIGVDSDEALSVLHHHIAASAGIHASNMALGHHYMFGEGTKCQAAEFFLRAAENGSIHSGNVLEIEVMGANGGRGPGLAGHQKVGKRGVNNDQVKHVEYLADSGNPIAMTNLGYGYLFGVNGLPQDYAHALRYLRPAADLGNPHAQFLLGGMLARGQGVPADVPGALGLMEQAAAQGHVDALNALGFFSTQDVEGRPADWAKAREYFEKSAELGNATGMYNSGFANEYGKGGPVDYEKAAQWYQKGASQGDGTSRLGMARLFMQGLGVPKDCAAAASLLVLPASWGNWSFANRWGLDAYLNDRNPSAALILFARAASLGYDRAQMNLVWLLRSHPSDARNVLGSGERVRAAEATMLRRATRLGNGEAALELALEYAAGRIVRGGTEGAEAAVRLWRQMADSKSAEAEFYLGVAHLSGRGAAVDPLLARSHFRRARETTPDASLAVLFAEGALAVRSAAEAWGGGLLSSALWGAYYGMLGVMAGGRVGGGAGSVLGGMAKPVGHRGGFPWEEVGEYGVQTVVDAWRGAWGAVVGNVEALRNAPPREAYTVLMAMAACAMGLLVVRELRRRAAVHPEGFAALLRRFGVGRGRGGVRPEGSVSERGASEGPRGVEGEVAGAVEGEGEEEDEGGVGEGESGSAVEQAEDGERRYSEGGAMY